MIFISVLGTVDLSGHNKENRLESLNDLFRSLFEQQEIVQEVIIDGVVYRENYNDILLEQLMNIGSIEVKTVHEGILMKEIMDELKEYLPKIIRACDSISELFYGEMTGDNWNQFGQLTQGAQWVNQSAHVLLKQCERVEGVLPIQSVIVRFMGEFENYFKQLETDMQNNDFTSVADIIKYEMPDLFKLLLNELEAEVYS